MAKNPSELAPPLAPVAFISSTVEDLALFRDAAQKAVIECGLLPQRCEYWEARGDREPLGVCLDRVDGGHVLIAIVAHRYGWVPTDQEEGAHKSITWLECERAVGKGREVLAFIVEKDAEWAEQDRESHRSAEATERMARGEAVPPELFATIARNVARLGDFKAWLQDGRVRACFSTPDGLRAEVFKALSAWKVRHPELAAASAPRPGAAADPGPYLRRLLESVRSIDIRGLQVKSGKAHSFPIDQLFLTLTTAAPGPRGPSASSFGADIDPQRTGPVPLHEALSQRRLVIVGDPGSGKTTFLRRLAFALCQDLLQPGASPAAALGLEDAPFPLLVRLPELAEHIAKARRDGGADLPATPDAAAWIPRFLAKRADDELCPLDESYFLMLLQEGKAILLLDSLDEAPDRRTRERLASLVGNAARSFEKCRMVVTCRPPAYAGDVIVPGFEATRIDPLGDEAIAVFLGRWCQALHPTSPGAAAKLHGELVDALQSRPEIRRLARNPVMLTALAVVHWNESRIPEQRAELYDSIIKWLSRSREDREGRPKPEACVELLQELALAMQDHPEGRKAQVPKRWAAEAIAGEWRDLDPRQRVARSEQFLDEEEVDSGIVVGRGNETTFWHLTFQEFLAARAIGARNEVEQQRLLWTPPDKLYRPEWRETALLFGGVLHAQGRRRVDGLFAGLLDRLGNSPTPAEEARAAGLLGSMLRDLGPLGYQSADPRYAELLERVTKIFQREHAGGIPLEHRVQAAEALGQAGDPRLDPRHPERWVDLPAVTCLRGAQKRHKKGTGFDSAARDDESPVREVELRGFRIGRWPVLVGEYRRFLEDGGYKNKDLWGAGGFGRWNSPEAWESQEEFPGRPVVGVSWYEAAAYATSLGARLPTEAQWERAARGQEGRRYPWGDEEPAPERLNCAPWGAGRPTPPGIFPAGSTPDPEGVQDLAGNVWEWCADWYDEGYYAQSPRVDPGGPATGEYRVLRGGSWGGDSGVARSADRNGDRPECRDISVGFRLVL